MEETKALQKLTEAADLISLIEDMLSSGNTAKLSTAAWSGFRITLRNAREIVQGSQSALAHEFIARSRNTSVKTARSHEADGPGVAATTSEKTLAERVTAERNGNSRNSVHSIADENDQAESQNGPVSPTAPVNMSRKDLKASLEKYLES